MLIVDECHRAGSNSNAAALDGPHIATLGMSATPFREYDDAFSEIIEPKLGGVVFSYTVNDAGADGIITPFDLVNVAVDLLPDEAEEYDALTRRLGRMRHQPGVGDSDPRLKALLLKRARVSASAAMRPPVAVRLADAHRGARSQKTTTPA